MPVASGSYSSIKAASYSPPTHFYSKRIVYRSSHARAAAAGRPAASGTLLEATRGYPDPW